MVGHAGVGFRASEYMSRGMKVIKFVENIDHAFTAAYWASFDLGFDVEEIML